MKIAPQFGFQRQFLSCGTDIAIGGGAAGVGKSFALVAAPLAYVTRPRFTWGFFRRSYPELVGPESIWEESRKIYPYFGGEPAMSPNPHWRFPTPGVQCGFYHLQHEKTAEEHKSKAYTYIALDEVTTMLEFQFWYLWSRTRSLSGVRPYMRGATNPDPDSFVRQLIDWWITCDGYPDPDRGGKVRWFVRLGDSLKWSDDRLALEHSTRKQAQSFTFIPGFLHDNKILLKQDPGYATKLDNLPEVERERLLGGNWDIKRRAGDYFDRGWFFRWDESLPDCQNLDRYRIKQVRSWDLAATPVSGDQCPGSDPAPDVPRSSDPDWTRGVKVSRLPPGWQVDYVVEHLVSARDRGGAIEKLILDTARHDGPGCVVHVWQDPGQAGKDQAERLQKLIKRAGFRCRVTVASKNKETYAKRPSQAAEKRRVGYVPGRWSQVFFNEIETFPDVNGSHDDIVDALSGAFLELGDAIPNAIEPKNPGVHKSTPRGNQAFTPMGFGRHRGML